MWIAKSRLRLLWTSVAVAGTCLVSMAFVDRALALWLHAHVGPETKAFFGVVTQIGDATWYLVGGMAGFALCHILARHAADQAMAIRYRDFARYPLLVFAGIAVSGIILNLAKFVIGRQRPRALFQDDVYAFIPFNWDFGMNSFPSGHSQSIWAAAIALGFMLPKARPFFILIAVLVALSRVVIGAHYLSDVIAGAILGASTVWWLHSRLVVRGGTKIVMRVQDSS